MKGFVGHWFRLRSETHHGRLVISRQIIARNASNVEWFGLTPCLDATCDQTGAKMVLCLSILFLRLS